MSESRPPQRPQPPATVVQVLAALTALIGVVMIVIALAGGGGLGSYGVLVGAFFLAAGIMRLRWIALRKRAERERNS